MLQEKWLVLSEHNFLSKQIWWFFNYFSYHELWHDSYI